MAVINYFIFLICLVLKIIPFSNSLENDYKTFSDNNIVLAKRQSNYNKDIISKTVNNLSIRNKRQIGLKEFYPWKLPIPYHIEANIDKRVIFEVIKQIRMQTCLTFTYFPTPVNKLLGIRYKYAEFCDKNPGRLTSISWQDIYVNDKCKKIGYIFRETLRLLGLVYEHQRKCRDNYVHIIPQHFSRFSSIYFSVLTNDVFGNMQTPYDYGSVMHPDGKFLGNLNEETILPVYPFYKKTMGQLYYPSFIDFKRINSFYCLKKCLIKIKCFHGGYPDPNICAVCKCVTGFTGMFCEKFQRPTRKCPSSILEATHRHNHLMNHGIKNCSYLIKAPKNNHVEVRVLYAIFDPPKRICDPFNSLEIKFMKDKTTTGVRLCGFVTNFTIRSMDSCMMLYFNSKNANNKFFLKYTKH
ncbi:Astacin-like metalloendopeptidase [Strongyloides ratti]|uniref:Metalloendopeptidase n=1 Tax=Strongyloides ratti TaxID=34506 RepID=A0A090N008_STRRB|nr:Astacin-like metalloendopeptidase [Strongyloides ratti]CEF69860.1 Astacin-like metalloendopeptidase [Strongyloides ratti]